MGMVAKTIHVYPFEGTWAVKRQGKSAKIYRTRNEAIDAARKSIKRSITGQFIVLGKHGQITAHSAYRRPRIQEPPGKSSRAAEIKRAVGEVILRHLQSETFSEHPPQE
jgi:hypothetical protein